MRFSKIGANRMIPKITAKMSTGFSKGSENVTLSKGMRDVFLGK
jgi:hypothetical protein